MKNLYLTIVLILGMTSCDYPPCIENKNKYDNHIKKSLQKVKLRVQNLGMPPNALKLQMQLNDTLAKIDLASRSQDDPTESFLVKIKLIEECHEALNYDLYYINEITPYIVEISPDTALILCDITNHVLIPNIYLKDKKYIKQVNVQKFNPLSVNLKNKDWHHLDSRRPLQDTSDLGLYSTKGLAGLDMETRITRKIKAYQ